MVHEDRQSVGIVIQQEPRGYIVATKCHEYFLSNGLAPPDCGIGSWLLMKMSNNRIIESTYLPKSQWLTGSEWNGEWVIFEDIQRYQCVWRDDLKMWTILTNLKWIPCDKSFLGEQFFCKGGRVVIRRTSSEFQKAFDSIRDINFCWIAQEYSVFKSISVNSNLPIRQNIQTKHTEEHHDHQPGSSRRFFKTQNFYLGDEENRKNSEHGNRLFQSEYEEYRYNHTEDRDRQITPSHGWDEDNYQRRKEMMEWDQQPMSSQSRLSDHMNMVYQSKFENGREHQLENRDDYYQRKHQDQKSRYEDGEGYYLMEGTDSDLQKRFEDQMSLQPRNKERSRWTSEDDNMRTPRREIQPGTSLSRTEEPVKKFSSPIGNTRIGLIIGTITVTSNPRKYYFWSPDGDHGKNFMLEIHQERERLSPGDWIRFEMTEQQMRNENQLTIFNEYEMIRPPFHTNKLSSGAYHFEIILTRVQIPENLKMNKPFRHSNLGFLCDPKYLLLSYTGRKVNIKMVWDNKAESFYEQTLIVLDVSPVDSSLSESTNSSTRNSREYLNNERASPAKITSKQNTNSTFPRGNITGSSCSQRSIYTGSLLNSHGVPIPKNCVWYEPAFIVQQDHMEVSLIWLTKTLKVCKLRRRDNLRLGTCFEGEFQFIEDEIRCNRIAKDLEPPVEFTNTDSEIEVLANATYHRSWGESSSSPSIRIFRTENLGDVLDIYNIVTLEFCQVLLRFEKSKYFDYPVWIVHSQENVRPDPAEVTAHLECFKQIFFSRSLNNEISQLFPQEYDTLLEYYQSNELVVD